MWNAFVKRSRCSKARLGVLGGVLVMAQSGVLPVALGQAPTNPRATPRTGAPVQTGVVLDRNPQLGSGGYNYSRPVSPLLSGNVIASGLASGGLSLRSFEPIPDPTAFRGTLGSASLSAFRRDSVSVASPVLGSGSYGQAFYDPSTTVPTVGLLESLAGVRFPDSGSPRNALDLRVQTRMDLQGGLKAGIIGLRPPASAVPPEVPPSLATSSSIFGTQPPPRLILPTESERLWQRTVPPEMTGRGREGREDGTEAAPAELKLPGVSELLATPLGGFSRKELHARFGVTVPSTEAQKKLEQPGLVLPAEATAESVFPATPRTVDAQLLPGFDVFTDMRLAVALLSNPNASWFDEMRRILRERPELARQVDEQAAQDAGQFLDQMLHAPLRSLTGAGPSALNDQMLKAESSLGIGHYSEAVDRYDAAHLIDPVNPLPLIGKGHALLAQGNYRSAALALVQGIELADRYPGLASLLLKRLDLKALMGGGEVVDIRRADIMRQLGQGEDPLLRFLLGYLEYHSGDHEHGLENLRRAASNPRAGMVIARYPALLGGETPPVPPGPAQPAEEGAGVPGSAGTPRRDVSSQPARELVIPPRTE